MTPDEEAELYREIGRRLRAARNATGLSLADVERKSSGNWKGVRIGSYERGQRSIGVGTLRELADWYGVPVTALIPGAEGPDVQIGDILGVLHLATDLQNTVTELRRYCDGMTAAIEPEGLRNGSTQDREIGETTTDRENAHR